MVHRLTMSSGSIFQGDPDFCSDCGAILPLPGSESTVACVACGYKVDVKKFYGITITYEIKYDNKGKYKKRKEAGNRENDSGPLVDRVCAKCGNPKMTYATLQTRSADEGQTVFYSCPNPDCRHQEHENS